MGYLIYGLVYFVMFFLMLNEYKRIYYYPRWNFNKTLTILVLNLLIFYLPLHLIGSKKRKNERQTN
jgi:hypothetical protein